MIPSRRDSIPSNLISPSACNCEHCPVAPMQAAPCQPAHCRHYWQIRKLRLVPATCHWCSSGPSPSLQGAWDAGGAQWRLVKWTNEQGQESVTPHRLVQSHEVIRGCFRFVFFLNPNLLALIMEWLWFLGCCPETWAIWGNRWMSSDCFPAL